MYNLQYYLFYLEIHVGKMIISSKCIILIDFIHKYVMPCGIIGLTGSQLIGFARNQ